MLTFRYSRGSEHDREVISFDLYKADRINGTADEYVTTCVVDVDLLIIGVRLFPCGNGDDRKITPGEALEALLRVREERAWYRDAHPVKTREAWHNSGLRTFEEFVFPGDEVDDAMVEHFVNSVPPVMNRATCTQAGEEHNFVYDDEHGWSKPTYVTFHRVGHDRWKFDGYCFRGENENRVEDYDRLARAIKKLQEEE